MSLPIINDFIRPKAEQEVAVCRRCRADRVGPVPTGDLNGKGRFEIIAGAGAGGGPQVRVFDSEGQLMSAFFAFDPGFTGGVNVATGRVRGIAFASIICGAGRSQVSRSVVSSELPFRLSARVPRCFHQPVPTESEPLLRKSRLPPVARPARRGVFEEPRLFLLLRQPQEPFTERVLGV